MSRQVSSLPGDGTGVSDAMASAPSFALSRRGALGVAAGTLIAAALTSPDEAVAAATIGPLPMAPLAVDPAQVLAIRTTINGQSLTLRIDPRTSLLDLLRERLALTGAKKGCDHGQCGACTVHIDGQRVASCLTLAAKIDGRKVRTIEGLSKGEALHPMQQAFIDHDALQCGYCTPGQIMSAVACVAEGHATSRASIREYMSGNICRCGAYPGIVAAIEQAATKMGKG